MEENLHDFVLEKDYRHDRKNTNHKSKKLINQTSSNFEIFYSLKDTVKKIKSQFTDKILAKHMSDNGLI